MPWMLRPVGIGSIASRSSTAVVRRRGHVDDRRGAGDGDRLLEGADAEFGVDRRGELRRQLQAVALEAS